MEIKIARRSQTTARDGHRVLRLPVSVEPEMVLSPYFQLEHRSDTKGLLKEVWAGRNTNILVIMAYKAIVKSMRDGGLNTQEVDYAVYDISNNSGAGANTIDVAVNVANSGSEIQSLLIAAIIADALTNFSTVVLPENVYFTSTSMSRSFSVPSLAVNTARQASATRDAFVSAAVDITAALSLTGGATGKVALQYADDSAFTTNVVTVNPAQNGNTGTLTIGLALNQLNTATVCGVIPSTKYYRLQTTNVTGTPTYGTPVIQEVLL